MRILYCGFTHSRRTSPSALRFRRGRCRRRQIAGVDFVGKPNDLVGTVAEGLVGRVAATAKRDFRPAGEPEAFSSGINDLEVTFDPQRTVVRGSDFRRGHGCLRQEFSGAAPSNKPLRYVGTRPNSTRGFFALTVACSLKKRYCCSSATVVFRKNLLVLVRLLLCLAKIQSLRETGRFSL